MKAKLAWGVALLTACSGGSGQGSGQGQPAPAEGAGSPATEEGGDVAGSEPGFVDEFSCPELASIDPVDLNDPEVASWVAMAQGHHELTLGWRRLVLSDEVVGFEEHTSVSLDVNVLGGRQIVYGSGGIPEYAGCDGLRGGRQLDLEITLATADDAVAMTFRSWFEPAPTDTRGTVLRYAGLNSDVQDTIELNGTLELGSPALGRTPQVGIDIEFAADGVRGSLSPGVPPEDSAWNLSSWRPIEGIFPDDPCGSQGRSIGLDEPFTGLVSTPRALYQAMARNRGRVTLPAVWTSTPYQVVPSPEDPQLEVPPPTDVTLVVGEPIRACAIETSLTVYAPLTVTTADGRVNLTQTFAFNLYESNVSIVERTPWVPAADFNQQIGLGGMNLESGYGSVSFNNNLDWQYLWIYGGLEVSQWDAFLDQHVPYPVLQWCSGPDCVAQTE